MKKKKKKKKKIIIKKYIYHTNPALPCCDQLTLITALKKVTHLK